MLKKAINREFSYNKKTLFSVFGVKNIEKWKDEKM